MIAASVVAAAALAAGAVGVASAGPGAAQSVDNAVHVSGETCVSDDPLRVTWTVTTTRAVNSGAVIDGYSYGSSAWSERLVSESERNLILEKDPKATMVDERTSPPSWRLLEDYGSVILEGKTLSPIGVYSVTVTAPSGYDNAHFKLVVKWPGVGDLKYYFGKVSLPTSCPR